MKRLESIVQALLLAMVAGYRRWISPAKKLLFGPTSGCRFHPTCSEYAAEVISRRGPFCGSAMAVKRLARCHPWHEGGFDPVPESPAMLGK